MVSDFVGSIEGLRQTIGFELCLVLVKGFMPKCLVTGPFDITNM